MILDTKTFVKPIYRVDSKQLVSVYQGRAYLERGIPQETDGELNPYVFADFFSEAYKTYILDPDFLIKKNFRLWQFIEGLTV